MSNQVIKSVGKKGSGMKDDEQIRIFFDICAGIFPI